MDRRHTAGIVAAIVLSASAGCRSLPYNPNPACGPCSQYFGPPQPSCGVEQPAPAPPRGASYENLVLEGGGVKGAGYAGALDVLDRNQLLSPVKRVAGNSAGSIVALLVALGYTPAEIEQVLLDLDFSRFRDGRFISDVERLRSQFGWYKGDFALCLFECLVERKTGSRQTTFAQLAELARTQPDKGFRDLHVFGTNVDTHRWTEFSAENPDARDLPLAQAVRISMSIPYFFAARRFKGDVYVDGGVLINYPIDVFDRTSAPEATLGLHLGTAPTAAPVDNLLSFTGELFHTLLDQQVDILCATPADIQRSVFIDPLGIGATDFGITREQKCALVRSGVKATDAYLREATHAAECPVFVPKLRPAGVKK